MIKSKEELLAALAADKKLYINSGRKQFLNASEEWYIYQYLKALRKCEYHLNNAGIWHKLRYFFYLRKKNRLGIFLGIYAWPNSIGAGILIAHTGSILINGNAKIGKNCIFHGENCIGNIGYGDIAPVLDDNIELGVGAKVIGDVYLAKGVKVGANAVVLTSCFEENATLVGVPARIVSSKK